MKLAFAVNSMPGVSAAFSAIEAAVRPAIAEGRRLIFTVTPEKRTTEQNKLLWAALGDVSSQVDWHGQRLESGEWKDVFSAALKRQKVVPGIDGGFVVLGSSTSAMSKAELSELMELIFYFGAERDVIWSEPKRSSS